MNQVPQSVFNQIKGIVTELNDGDRFCSITISAGHEKPREVNFIIKKPDFDQFCLSYSKGDRVILNFYVNSKNKYGRWYTMANIISWE